ncbi:hypothetical protein NCS57_00002700 [Fusarium keratoplasticum]|uniref:Uncharacterized protein n=1 Tax=Fusarium keratoplasticum TaxID=1328300 RepID=A0ACC0RBQ3_9HYPO|nr:hypothetical protein NCS57_00002700 [Fusarium keratoplasticum]KAI8683386.1 hypothetical protein NCS57_00002700 [Fusarium keratoplasticum]
MRDYSPVISILLDPQPGSRSSQLVEDGVIADPGLPHFDEAISTKRYCQVALWASYFISISAIACSIWLLAAEGGLIAAFLPDRLAQGVAGVGLIGEFLPLVFNLLIAGCTEAVSYIHAVSLRWALYREGRLEFNSNLRLFTSAESSRANTRSVNFVSAACLIICYTAASQVLIGSRSSILVNGIALLMLGIGLLSLSIVSTMCLWDNSNTILTWSPSPLNTTLACLNHGIIGHHPGRGMLAVDDRYLLSQPASPRRRQCAMNTVYPATRYIVYFQYGVVVLCAILAIVILVLIRKLNPNGVPTYAFFADETGTTDLYFEGGIHGANLYPLWLFCTFLFAIVPQAFFVMALHGAELLVTVARDEAAWREAAARRGPGRGAVVAAGAPKSAVKSWLWLSLLLYKPVSSWLLTSQGIKFQIQQSTSRVVFNPIPLFALTGLSLLLVAFEEWLTRWRTGGPQPAAYGHLQTLADLVDDWGPSDISVDERKLWWGSKGFDPMGEALVGTSAKKEDVGEIDFDQRYK